MVTQERLISVVLPTYNRAAWLRETLDSLLRQRTGGAFEFEIVVVDNASTDTTPVVVEQAAKESQVSVRCFYEPNQGVAQARNRGLRKARGTWIAFMDDDELAEPDWLRRLYEAAVKTGSPCTGGAVHLDVPADVYERLGHVQRRALRERRAEGTLQPYRGRDFPGTDNVLYARKLFEELGGFDETMMRGGSDNDFAIRVRGAGYPMWHEPRAVVRHRIAPDRFSVGKLKHTEQKTGAGLAYFDHKYKGTAKMAFYCVARIGQALMINVPLLAWACMRRDRREALDRRALLWRAGSYVRQTLAILGPKLFSQDQFFRSLRFREGRTAGQPRQSDQ